MDRKVGSRKPSLRPPTRRYTAPSIVDSDTASGSRLRVQASAAASMLSPALKLEVGGCRGPEWECVGLSMPLERRCNALACQGCNNWLGLLFNLKVLRGCCLHAGSHRGATGAYLMRAGSSLQEAVLEACRAPKDSKPP